MAQEDIFKNPNFLPLALADNLRECHPEMLDKLSIPKSECDKKLNEAKFDCVHILLADKKELVSPDEMTLLHVHFINCQSLTLFGGCKYDPKIFESLFKKENQVEVGKEAEYKEDILSKAEEKQMEEYLKNFCPSIDLKAFGL